MRLHVTDQDLQDDMEVERVSRPEWIVPHPVTGVIIHNPVFARAIMENAYVVENGKVYVHWDQFMAHRQPYLRVPDWFGFTEEETQLYYKMCREAFIEPRMLRTLWPGNLPVPPMEMIQRLKIPLYRFPFPKGRKGYQEFVFAGDLVRAFRGCEVPYLTDVFHAADLRRRVKWDRRNHRKNAKDRKREKAKRMEQVDAATAGVVDERTQLADADKLLRQARRKGRLAPAAHE